jgi:hypothetical protein
MATTTNYGWTTPDDTALVKDGASAIRTLGSSVDTTTKNLNPETTLGDISFRSSTSNVNTRLGIGSSGQFLSVVAGVPAWAALTDLTPLTTKGDLFTFSTLDARLGVGANNTVLTADSAEATGLKWAAAGGMTLINSGGTSLTGSSVSISSIPGTYNYLYINVENFRPATDGAALRMRYNNDSNNRYSETVSNGVSQGFTQGQFNSISGDTDNTATTGFSQIQIYNYASTTMWKYQTHQYLNANYTTPTNSDLARFAGAYNQTTAITELNFFCSSGNFNAGTVYVYGVK